MNVKHFLRLVVVATACSTWVACGRTIVVNNTADQSSATVPDGRCPLREAIVAANTNGLVGGCLPGQPGADVIQLPAGT